MGRFAPMAAAMGSSIRYTSRAPADWADSFTARFSTWVMPVGTQMMMRGRTRRRELWTLEMKWRSMASVTSKSAMTPSFMGRMATMLPGVRPSIFLASAPTASTLLTPRASFLTATTDGSESTIPLPFTYTSVLAVPRSMARSLEKNPNAESKSLDMVPSLTQSWSLASCGVGLAARLETGHGGRQKKPGRARPAL